MNKANCTLLLTVSPTYSEIIASTICSGDNFTFGTQTLTSSGTYSETFTSINGCDSIVALTLSVNPSYSITETMSICSGANYNFGTQTLTASGNYSDTFISINGCDSTLTLNLTVNPLPQIPAIFQISDTLFSSSLTGNQWFWANNIISDEILQFYIPASDGVYTVIVTDTNGCTSSSEPFNFTTLSLNENPGRNEIKIYPNPSRGSFTLELPNSNERVNEICLFTLTGRLVYLKNIRDSESRPNAFDFSFLSAGEYLLQVETNKGVGNRKIVLW